VVVEDKRETKCQIRNELRLLLSIGFSERKKEENFAREREERRNLKRQARPAANDTQAAT